MLPEEGLIPVTQPSKIGSQVSVVTLKRWIKKGLRSRVTGRLVRLEHAYEGKILCTSKLAYIRFLRRLNGFKEPGQR